MKNCFLTQRTNLGARRGFTLIEILVTIGIILLLAGLTFPVFSRVREGGRTTTCSNNLRQLGIAFQQYMQDNRRYPLPGQYQRWADGAHWIQGGDMTKAIDFPSPSGKGFAEPTDPFDYVTDHRAYVEQGAIFPYVKEARTYLCPSAKDVEKKKLSYSMNCALAAVGEARIRTPSEIVLLVDEGETINDGYFWATNNTSSTDALMKKHNGGGNLLFVDGHVKFFPFSTFPIDGTPAGQSLKAAKTGPVRFLDLGFGPKGASVVPALQDAPLPSATPTVTDSCGSTVS